MNHFKNKYELSSNFQAILLRFLEENEFCPVAGIENKYSDVRVIAITNQNLK